MASMGMAGHLEADGPVGLRVNADVIDLRRLEGFEPDGAPRDVGGGEADGD